MIIDVMNIRNSGVLTIHCQARADSFEVYKQIKYACNTPMCQIDVHDRYDSKRNRTYNMWDRLANGYWRRCAPLDAAMKHLVAEKYKLHATDEYHYYDN